MGFLKENYGNFDDSSQEAIDQFLVQEDVESLFGLKKTFNLYLEQK